MMYDLDDYGHDYDLYDALDIIETQMSTDYLVEDSFREALEYDLFDTDDHTHHPDEWIILYDNEETLFDLCDIVEQAQKGYIIHG